MLIIQIEGGQRYVPTAILNRIAFYPASSFQVLCSGECLDPQMKNLPASDMSVRKAKAGMSWAQQKMCSTTKGLFLLPPGQEEQLAKTSVSPWRVLQCSSWQQGGITQPPLSSVFCQEGWDSFPQRVQGTLGRGNWGPKQAQRLSDCLLRMSPSFLALMN